MNMFDKDNELSILLLEQLAHNEFASYKNYWVTVKTDVINGTYEDINTAMSCVANKEHLDKNMTKYLYREFTILYKDILRSCNILKQRIDKPITVDKLKEKFVQHLREKYGDAK